MATINDVARRAAVAPATVSNVLSGKVRVRAATRARVLAAIEALDYRPNLVARGLAHGRSYVLALLLTDIANPFYAEIARAVEGIARAHGYRLLVCNTDYDARAGFEYLEDLAGRQVDGLVVMGGSLGLADVRTAAARGLSVVLCGWEEEPCFAQLAGAGPLPPAVGVDFGLGGALAARHLLALGHRRIGVIVQGASADGVIHTARLQGFRLALAEGGGALDHADVRYGDSSLSSGYDAATALLSGAERPTAIFATNDLMALGALNAAYDLRLRVPQDVSVIGFDDIAFSAHVRPALTTVGLPTRELATEAMELLLRCVGGWDHPSYHLTLRPYLVARGSTAVASSERGEGGIR